MRLGTISLALFAVVGLIAGCGSSTSTTTNTSTKAASASPSATSPTATASSTSAGTSFASTQNCQQLAALGAKYEKEVAAATTGGTLDLSAVIKADQAMADASPSAIHSQAETVVQGFATFLASLGKVGYKPGTPPTASQIAALESAAQQFRQPQFVAATQQVSAWVRQNCRGVTP